MHVFSSVVWLGGLMFQSAVATPIVNGENEYAKVAMKKVNKRFIGFIWMSVWTMAVTGAIMMLLSPNFLWFRYDTRWSVLLALKQIIFVLMTVYAFGYARMQDYLGSPSSNGGFNERAELYRHRSEQFRTISIMLGISALLLAAAMVYS
jgi:uncharacterized membrane protein